MKKINPDVLFSRVANIAVIAGIIILAVEIQQNTRSIEVSAFQDFIGEILALGDLSVENASFNARVDYLVALSDEQYRTEEISPEEAGTVYALGSFGLDFREESECRRIIGRCEKESVTT